MSYANDDDVHEYLSDEAETPLPVAADEPKRADEARKAIIIENLPVTTQDKFEKLKMRVTELLQQVDPSGNAKLVLHMPVDDQKSTLGFAFAAFTNEELAKSAVELINGFKLGKNELSVFPYSDLEKLEAISDKYVAPAPSEYVSGVDLSWMEDGRDQFAMRHGPETVVSWIDSVSMNGEMQVAYGGER